jgi:hypothetical protein
MMEPTTLPCLRLPLLLHPVPLPLLLVIVMVLPLLLHLLLLLLLLRGESSWNPLQLLLL